MREVLIVLAPSATESQRQAVTRAAPVAQTISDRVFTSTTADAAALRSMSGVAAVLTGGESAQALPPLDDTETLFVQAWLTRAGQAKQRPGEGLNWDAPGMAPPDRPRGR